MGNRGGSICEWFEGRRWGWRWALWRWWGVVWSRSCCGWQISSGRGWWLVVRQRGVPSNVQLCSDNPWRRERRSWGEWLRDARVRLPVPRGILLHSHGRPACPDVRCWQILSRRHDRPTSERVPRGVLLPTWGVIGHVEPYASRLFYPRRRIPPYTVLACDSSKLKLRACTSRNMDVDVLPDVFWRAGHSKLQRNDRCVLWHSCSVRFVRCARCAPVRQRRVCVR